MAHEKEQDAYLWTVGGLILCSLSLRVVGQDSEPQISPLLFVRACV